MVRSNRRSMKGVGTSRRSLRGKRTKTKSTNTNTNTKKRRNQVMKVDDSKLGWSEKVRTQNLNKLLVKASKQGVKTLIIEDWHEGNENYNVNKEIKKRKLKI